MKKVIFFIFISFSINNLYAQLFNASKDIAKTKDRTLIVVLQEEDQGILKRFKSKPEKIAQHKAIISAANSILTSAFKNYWNLDKVEFKTMKEICALTSPSDTNYFIFNYKINLQIYEINPALEGYKLRKELFKKNIYGIIEISLAEKLKKNTFYKFFVQTSYPFESDIIIAVQQIRNYFEYKISDLSFNARDYENIISSKNGLLINKTLLLDSSQVEKNTGSYDFIKEEYPFNCKLTDHKEIAEAIKNKDTSFVYVAVVPHHDQINRGGTFEGTTGGGMDTFGEEMYYSHLVINAASEEVVGFGKNIEPIVNKRALKNYIKYIDPSNFNLNNLTK